MDTDDAGKTRRMRVKIKNWASLAAVLPALALGFAGTADAQDYQRVAPKDVPNVSEAPGDIPGSPPKLLKFDFLPKLQPAPEVASPPSAPTTKPADKSRQILSELIGIRLVPTISALNRDGAHGAGLSIESLPILDGAALKTSLAAFLHKPLTLGDLDAISAVIVDWYRTHDRPFVDVAFPEQDISTGVVQAVVTEFHAGEIRVEDNKWFSTDLLRDQIRMETGDPISAKSLNDDLAWLSQNPFRQVNLVAQKSAIPGAADFTLKAEDRLPVRVYAGYDNTGTPVLGHDRWNLGLNWGNAFWLDQQLSYQFTSSDDFWHSREKIPGKSGDPTFAAHSVSYLVPLPWRDTLTIFGSYAQAVPRVGPDLNVVGVSGQASLRYSIQLPTIPNLTHNLQFGYDFKTSNNNLEFGGQLVSAVTTEINQFPVIYAASYADDYGQTTLENTFVFSPGDLTPGNKDILFEAQANSPLTKSKYIYDHLVAARITRLPFEASWVTQVTWQSADRNLLPSEQLGAGGVDSVRGYDERAVNGSEGVLVSEELRSPAFSISKQLLDADIGDQAQILTFWDYGSVHEKQLLDGLPSGHQIESVGLGLRYLVGRFVDFRLDYGWQLRKLTPTTARSELGHVSLTVGY